MSLTMKDIVKTSVCPGCGRKDKVEMPAECGANGEEFYYPCGECEMKLDQVIKALTLDLPRRADKSVHKFTWFLEELMRMGGVYTPRLDDLAGQLFTELVKMSTIPDTIGKKS